MKKFEISEERRSGGQEGKLFNDSSLKETPTCHYEEGNMPPFNKGGGPRSGGGILPDEVIQPISVDNNKKLDCFANARNDVKNSIVKALSPYSPIALSPSNKKAAFTLAEVLIVITVIGVVAALTIPMFMTELSERLYSERQANVAQKFTKAVELMITAGDYEKFDTTEEFVDKLEKYLKITKRCDSDNLTKCWPTKTVSTSETNKYEVQRAKNGISIHTGSTTNNVGLILNDGTSIILNYNPDAALQKPDDGFISTRKSLPIGGGKTKDFVYTSNATDAIDFVMDVNGGSRPNAEFDEDGYYDIRSFRNARFGKQLKCDFEIGTMCVVNLGTTYTCIDTCSDTTWDSHGSENPNCSSNCWAGAKKACSDIGMTLASKDQLITMFNKNCTNGHTDCIETIPTSGGFWSLSETNTYYVRDVYFNNGSSHDNRNKYDRDGALCAGN